MEQHADKDGGLYECQHCGRKFKRKYHLARHDRICFNSPSNVQKLMCRACNILFQHEGDLLLHCSSHHYNEISLSI